jgi:hypothetical protein
MELEAKMSAALERAGSGGGALPSLVPGAQAAVDASQAESQRRVRRATAFRSSLSSCSPSLMTSAASPRQRAAEAHLHSC